MRRPIFLNVFSLLKSSTPDGNRTINFAYYYGILKSLALICTHFHDLEALDKKPEILVLDLSLHF